MDAEHIRSRVVADGCSCPSSITTNAPRKWHSLIRAIIWPWAFSPPWCSTAGIPFVGGGSHKRPLGERDQHAVRRESAICPTAVIDNQRLQPLNPQVIGRAAGESARWERALAVVEEAHVRPVFGNLNRM